jgi:formate hydrogenlyase transcriptional activator
MASLAEFTPTPQHFWPEASAQEESDKRRSDAFMKRYEALLRLSKCLTSARSDDFVTSIAGELHPVVDFDFLDIMINPAAPVESIPSSGGLEQSESEDLAQFSSEDTDRENFGGVICLPRGEEVERQCSIPLISRGSELGFLVLGRFDDDPFGEDDIEFLTQVAGQIAIVIDNSLAYRHIADLTEKLTPENIYFDDEILSETNFEEIVGRSAALRSLLRQVETVAPTDSTVLIYGETGTGKELIARALHNLSGRRSAPFVKLNCAAIPTGLLESELFGHERGAFTSAIAQRIGRFELANRGTIFLDEIGEIPLELQPKLLRVLQEREFERLGSSRTLTTDARLIAATNRDLSALVQEQKFRSDLFYRLNVFPVRVPALRERREDIALLVQHFVERFSKRMNRNIESVPKQGMDALISYSWPGNIRELENVIERAVILSSGPELRVPVGELSRLAPGADGWKPQTLEEAERAHILSTLKKTRWVLAGPNGAAIRLGLNRSTLQFRMKKLGIVRPGL